ncbi:AfsR/SARP family transcriptional regulator [Streptomyces sp. AN091965]|uniref:AfsR/SARP family transcriptional regulator n=1 Tax=Streptomyces sp. AN091965 TaxID=2927803 RepID=UPI001F61BB7F|nr:BTAD domain-containing putative transcriptional regulator [Streptomyces sp. AN091965]MCI3927851.1 tetratricopeptide repeat protein [Streptomyces sp. AN091965]
MEFGLLGPLEVRVDGERVELGGVRQRGLLAALALRPNCAVPLARLVDAVWDEDPPATAERQVRNMAGLLRRRLADVGPARPGAADEQRPAPLIASDGPGYRLAVPESAVDAHAFTDGVAAARAAEAAGDAAGAVTGLRSVLALWRGPALDGLPSWPLRSAAAALEEQRLCALEHCFTLELSLGRHLAVIPELSSLVAQFPLREGLVLHLMTALHRAGRQSEGLDVYRRHAARLADETGLDPGPELRALRDTLLRPGADRQPPVTARAPRPAPAQLPSDLPTFVGRSGELRRLGSASAPRGAAASGQGTAVTIVSGVPGTGKSTLALHWAHRHRHHYPDGQLFADLRGHAPGGPRRPGAVLAAFLRALGEDAGRIPTDQDEAAALYRTLLTDRRVLIVLDDARDAQQVRPLLPGNASCTVLVTSRERLTGLTARDGARRLDLAGFTASEGRALLTRMLGPQRPAAEPPQAVDALLAACGGLPLALGIAAARLRDQPHHSIAEFAAELAASDDRLGILRIDGDSATGVRAAFAHSYGGLESAPQRLFRRLGLFPGPDITLAAATALDDSGAVDRTLLDRLVRAHLLEERGPGLYRLHDLLRIFAAECAAVDETPAARYAARSRWYAWCLHHADAADRILAPHRRTVRLPIRPQWLTLSPFTTQDEAVLWCGAQRANLLATIHDAYAHGEDEVAWQLPALLWSYLRGHPVREDQIVVGRVSVDAACRIDDPHAQALSLNNLGSAYDGQTDPTSALPCLTEARELMRRTGDRVGEAHVLGNLGAHHGYKGDDVRAVHHWEEALAVLRDLPPPGDPWAASVFETNIGTAHLRTGRFSEARDPLRRAMALHRSLGNDGFVGFSVSALGVVRHGLGDPERAVAFHRRALRIGNGVGYPGRRATILACLAAAQHARGDVADSLRTWEEARALFDALPEAHFVGLRPLFKALGYMPPVTAGQAVRDV